MGVEVRLRHRGAATRLLSEVCLQGVLVHVPALQLIAVVVGEAGERRLALLGIVLADAEDQGVLRRLPALVGRSQIAALDLAVDQCELQLPVKHLSDEARVERARRGSDDGLTLLLEAVVDAR